MGKGMKRRRRMEGEDEDEDKRRRRGDTGLPCSNDKSRPIIPSTG
jgi:hypothetical protein